MWIRRIIWLLILVILGIVGVCGWLCWRKDTANSDFKRLLAGDQGIALVTVEIVGHGERIILNDSDSVNYLSRRLRCAQRGSGELGVTYYINARLSTGGFIRCALYLPEMTDRLTLSFPIDTVHDDTMHLVTLSEPVPDVLAGVLSRLRSR